jgi:hypothetical protein
VRCSEVFRLRCYIPSPQIADTVLRGHRFDLLVVSSVNDSDLHRIVNLSEGAEVLVLDGITMPSKLLSLVAQRLKRQRWAVERGSRHTA